MILKHISIVNFKNLRAVDVDPSPKLNCLLGPNGVGKTNFLDAVYYLSFCHGTSGVSDSQIVTHGEKFFMLEGDYETDEGTEEVIGCSWKQRGKKHFRRNDKDYRRLSQHIGLIPLILVTPSDSALVEGGGEERRKLMDVAISQYDRTYLDALMGYNKALQQRNALLRAEPEPDPALMEIWEEQMASQGEALFHKRENFIQKLAPVFQKMYEDVSDCREQVVLRYRSHAHDGNLLEIIRESRPRDRALGYSLHGVHRDDLEMLLGGYPLRREGSQGQLKTFVLSLKLAQFDFLRQASADTVPLLLLDDIFDKLDAQRVERIVRLVSGRHFGQIFITDTNRDHLDRILDSATGDYRIYSVGNGQITDRKEA